MSRSYNVDSLLYNQLYLNNKRSHASVVGIDHKSSRKEFSPSSNIQFYWLFYIIKNMQLRQESVKQYTCLIEILRDQIITLINWYWIAHFAFFYFQIKSSMCYKLINVTINLTFLNNSTAYLPGFSVVYGIYLVRLFYYSVKQLIARLF